MDQSERARLRALCEAATPGPECTGISARWCPRCGDCTCPDGEPADCPLCPLHARASAHGEDEEHGQDTAALLRLGDASRTALPALLHDLDAATHERDEARAEVERLRAIDQERREIYPLALEAVRTVAREACAKVVEGWLGEVRRVTRILVGAGITDGPAVDALRAAAGVLHGALDDIRARGAGGER